MSRSKQLTWRSIGLFGVLLALVTLLSTPPLHAVEAATTEADDATQSGDAGLPTVSALVSKAQPIPGFLPLYWQADKGRLLARIDHFDTSFIYYSGLSNGIGSNDLGLDRAQLGGTQLVRFERIGPRVLLVADNTQYRAKSSNPRERLAVDEAFASSVLWGFDIVAQHGDDSAAMQTAPKMGDESFDSDAVLIDVTEFALRDAHNVARRLAAAGEGSYSVDATRSAIYLPRTKGFPDNSDIDVMITLVGEPTGDTLATVSPDASAVTVHMHHAFVRLPDDGYTPLPYDPRAGFIDDEVGFYDYAVPLDQSVQRSYAWRHRLKKVDPTAARSAAVEPIVYYVDPGVPEPIRSALIEGASWWNQAFEAAGYIDAFQVKLLPEGADPMDIRYNVINWVHRSTRGWSYGYSIRDPRTQEILKGHVTLGSLRVRQDYLIAEGLLAPYTDEGEASDTSQAQLNAFALSRIRQLAAHEVGHTIGLEHNFAASADDRASVMDYPHPYVSLDAQGQVDLSDAYAVGIGAWDKRAITWGYQDFAPGIDAAEAREALIRETIASDLHFIADRHARANAFSSEAGPCHSRGSLWDNGADPVAELNRLMALRSVVLGNFSEAVIRNGQSYARIEEVLVPAYLMHRYQLQAAGTVLGGRDFSYALRGDGQQPTWGVEGQRQRNALQALLVTLQPAALALAPDLVRLIAPRPPGSPASRELFPRETGYLFDPLSAADTALTLSLRVLLDPTRAARLNVQHGQDPAMPNFAELLQQLMSTTWFVPDQTASPVAQAALQRRGQVAVLEHMLALVGNTQASVQVRADALDTLLTLDDWLAAQSTDSQAWRAHYRYAVARLSGLRTGEGLEATKTTLPPPGSPI